MPPIKSPIPTVPNATVVYGLAAAQAYQTPYIFIPDDQGENISVYSFALDASGDGGSWSQVNTINLTAEPLNLQAMRTNSALAATGWYDGTTEHYRLCYATWKGWQTLVLDGPTSQAQANSTITLDSCLAVTILVSRDGKVGKVYAATASPQVWSWDWPSLNGGPILKGSADQTYAAIAAVEFADFSNVSLYILVQSPSDNYIQEANSGSGWSWGDAFRLSELGNSLGACGFYDATGTVQTLVGAVNNNSDQATLKAWVFQAPSGWKQITASDCDINSPVALIDNRTNSGDEVEVFVVANQVASGGSVMSF